jgi:hypothetical protein
VEDVPVLIEHRQLPWRYCLEVGRLGLGVKEAREWEVYLRRIRQEGRPPRERRCLSEEEAAT